MAAYSNHPSTFFSSSGSLDDFQCNSIHDTNLIFQTHQNNPEILSENICDNITSDLQTNSKICESDFNQLSDKPDHPKCNFDLNGVKLNNSVIPNFSVGGWVSTHCQSQPNLNEAVNNNLEDTNQRNFVKDPSSYSIHAHSKSVEQPHCLHDQISQTNLACVIQDALVKRCNVFHVDQPASESTSNSQVVKYIYKIYQKLCV